MMRARRSSRAEDFRRTLREGAVIGAAALAAALDRAAGRRLPRPHGGPAPARAPLPVRRLHGPFDPRIGRNPKLLGALGLCFALQAAAQAVPPLSAPSSASAPLSPAGLARRSQPRPPRPP
ncbi:MAG: hypothetical protein RML45_01995 [Acetobacteraceae bacterium]|nr:hypothetical protein [Acetobacteraceae bacterium]